MRHGQLLACALATVAGISGCNAAKMQDAAFIRKGKTDSINAAAKPDSAMEQLTQAPGFLMPQTEKTKKYAVNGSAIPDVDFDIGESYAGLMPIDPDSDKRNLYFWLFPTGDLEGQDTVTIWLNGGPYCSSLQGLLTENGPFVWPQGYPKPGRNPWSWHLLTNIVYVETPLGVGFSTKGVQQPKTEEEHAQEFAGFFKNLLDTFELHNKKIYITGESFSGQYIPFFADYMFQQNDTVYFDVQGTLIYDPLFGDEAIEFGAFNVPFADEYKDIFMLNDTFNEHAHSLHESCGFKDYIEEHFKYPPAGRFPDLPDLAYKDECVLFSIVGDAWLDVNPCADPYHITDTCPPLPYALDPLPGFETDLRPYFNRSEVQKAINAPVGKWEQCGDGPFNGPDGDGSKLTAYAVYPRVIERSKRSLLVHGTFDFQLPYQASEMIIQNMTWGGAQGFSAPITEPFMVPKPDPSKETFIGWSGSGQMGYMRQERGFTYIRQWGAGHMVPGYQPASAFRQLQYLLGFIDSL